MKLIYIFLLFLLPFETFSQGKIFAVWEEPVTSAYWFVTLNVTTGVKTDISLIPGMSHFVAGNSTAFNADSMQYIFLGLDGSDTRIYTLDAVTGNVIYNPIISQNLVGLSYNCNDGLIYGVEVIGNSYNLISVDPATGSVVTITPINGITAYVSETFNFNQRLQQLNFVVHDGSGYRLRSYSVLSGGLINDNLFPDNVTALRYNCGDSAVYGLWENAGFYKFEKIDVVAGTHNTVSNLAGVTPGYVAESACINMSGNYIYRGFDSLNNFSIISIDPITGGVVNLVNTTDNAVGFEEGICCYDVSTSIPEDSYSDGVFTYPNPVSSVINISSEKHVHIFEVYSLKGESKCMMKSKEKSKTYSLDISNLDPGFYFLKITFDDGTVAFEKILKE